MRIDAIRHSMVHVPFVAPLTWGSGTLAGPTRLVVELTTESGGVGHGETICLLDPHNDAVDAVDTRKRVS